MEEEGVRCLNYYKKTDDFDYFINIVAYYGKVWIRVNTKKQKNIIERATNLVEVAKQQGAVVVYKFIYGVSDYMLKELNDIGVIVLGMNEKIKNFPFQRFMFIDVETMITFVSNMSNGYIDCEYTQQCTKQLADLEKKKMHNQQN